MANWIAQILTEIKLRIIMIFSYLATLLTATIFPAEENETTSDNLSAAALREARLKRLYLNTEKTDKSASTVSQPDEATPPPSAQDTDEMAKYRAMKEANLHSKKNSTHNPREHTPPPTTTENLSAAALREARLKRLSSNSGKTGNSDGKTEKNGVLQPDGATPLSSAQDSDEMAKYRAMKEAHMASNKRKIHNPLKHTPPTTPVSKSTESEDIAVRFQMGAVPCEFSKQIEEHNDGEKIISITAKRTGTESEYAKIESTERFHAAFPIQGEWCCFKYDQKSTVAAFSEDNFFLLDAIKCPYADVKMRVETQPDLFADACITVC